METEAMRKELRELIETGNDALIASLYEAVKDYDDIPEDRMRLIMQEREDYINGKGTSYSWEEAKAIVRSRKPEA